MPTSNDTRVRVLAFLKIMASVRPTSLVPGSAPSLRLRARASNASSSSRVTSVSARKSRFGVSSVMEEQGSGGRAAGVRRAQRM
jgi:hypothetical protein